jgi:hypothetical protein
MSNEKVWRAPQAWQITGPGLAVQAKFGQYLQDAKNPRSISQTEKAVEWEQVWSNEQILPTPVIHHYRILKYFYFNISYKGKIDSLTPPGKFWQFEFEKEILTVWKMKFWQFGNGNFDSLEKKIFESEAR